MASALRSKAPLRAAQTFSATAPKIPASGIAARKLHMTGAREASPALSSFENMMNRDPPKRSDTPQATRQFNTSRPLKAVNDSSTVDFAYMPEVSFANPSSTDLPQIPLLPDNYAAQRPSADGVEPVRMPEISTTALGSVVSAFSEADASKAADSMGIVDVKGGEEGVVRRVLGDMLDDILGASKKAAAA